VVLARAKECLRFGPELRVATVVLSSPDQSPTYIRHTHDRCKPYRDIQSYSLWPGDEKDIVIVLRAFVPELSQDVRRGIGAFGVFMTSSESGRPSNDVPGQIDLACVHRTITKCHSRTESFLEVPS